MPRFDIYANPNNAASHALYVDVQSDFVRLSTRWCIPLSRHVPPRLLIQGAQALIGVNDRDYILDAPNLLAVPTSLLRRQTGRLSAGDQLITESCMEFMLRGY